MRARMCVCVHPISRALITMSLYGVILTLCDWLTCCSYSFYSFSVSLFDASRLEPIILKILPIIPSQASQNFYLLFLFYSHSTTNYSFSYSIVSLIVSQCRSDYILYSGLFSMQKFSQERQNLNFKELKFKDYKFEEYSTEL